MTGWTRLRRRVRRLRHAPERTGPAAAHTPPPVCDDVRAWCATDPTAGYDVLRAPHRIVREPGPHTVEPVVHDVFAQYHEVDAPEQALVSVRQASLAANGLVFLPDGQLVGQGVTAMREHRAAILANEPAYTRPLPATTRELAGNSYPLVIGNAGNYYHWQQDVMVRLLSVLPLLPSDTRFIVPPGLRDFHHAMLAVVGVTDSELCEFRGDELWTCERLLFPIPYLKPMLHSPDTMVPFAHRCLAEYGIEQAPSARVLVSRTHDAHWRTTNEHDVIRVLGPLGFEAHDLAAMTFEAQVGLFASAEVVVGTGAGLSNVVFSTPGAKVLQLQDPAYPVGHHFTICNAMGHDYWYLMAEPVTRKASRYGRGDLRVPLDTLQESLEQMGVRG